MNKLLSYQSWFLLLETLDSEIKKTKNKNKGGGYNDWLDEAKTALDDIDDLSHDEYIPRVKQ